MVVDPRRHDQVIVRPARDVQGMVRGKSKKNWEDFEYVVEPGVEFIVDYKEPVS
jgi:hypothetical protein